MLDCVPKVRGSGPARARLCENPLVSRSVGHVCKKTAGSRIRAVALSLDMHCQSDLSLRGALFAPWQSPGHKWRSLSLGRLGTGADARDDDFATAVEAGSHSLDIQKKHATMMASVKEPEGLLAPTRARPRKDHIKERGESNDQKEKTGAGVAGQRLAATCQPDTGSDAGSTYQRSASTTGRRPATPVHPDTSHGDPG